MQRGEPTSMEEVHSLLLDQEEASSQKPDGGAVAANQTVESVPQNNIRNGGFESTLLSQLDFIARSPHLCRENDSSADAFGLRDMPYVAPEFKGYKTDANLLKVEPSTGLSLFPPGGVQNIAQRYSKPFQQDTHLPLHNTTATSDTGTTPDGYQNQNTLLPLSFVEQNLDQPTRSLPSTDPPDTQSKLQPIPSVQMGNAVPYEHSASQQIFDTNNTAPFSPSRTTDDGNVNNKDLAFPSRRQPFRSDIAPPFASAFDKHIPDAGSASHTSVGIIGDTKPVGFVPAVKGTTFKNEAEPATEAENVGEQGPDIAAAARLTTTAIVPPSSTVKPQQQADTSNANAETGTSSVPHTETSNECDTTKDTIRPPFMPGFPAPWPMPPYPGGPVPYPFFPPWPYGPPMPMMPMMPHPMMQMVPVPCWLPPMHPAMQMRPPAMVTPAADANEKPEVVSETKP